jgi:hypothetical protein
MSGIAAARIWTAGFWGAYAVAAAAVIIWSALLVSHGHDSQMAALLSRPWVALCAYAPVVIGMVMQLAGRRFWAWPYVYLLVFALAITSTTGDIGDQAYAYGGSVVWVVTVLVAESVGLTLGRWLHRFIGIAFFLGAGAWMLIEGFRGQDSGLVSRWQSQTLLLAGGLFVIHAAIQLANYRRKREAQAMTYAEEQTATPPPASMPEKTGETGESWIVQSGDSAAQSPDAQAGEGDNKGHE